MAIKRKKAAAPLQWWYKVKLADVFWLYHERSAFCYEVAARVNAKKGVPVYEFGKPWIKLTEPEKLLLSYRWPMPNTQETVDGHMFTDGVLSLGGLNAKPEPGWTGFSNVSYNLRYNDETIAQALLRFISNERKRQGIPNPKPNAGRRHRQRSWRPIELMDRHLGGEVMGEAERSQISKAKAKYREALASI